MEKTGKITSGTILRKITKCDANSNIYSKTNPKSNPNPNLTLTLKGLFHYISTNAKYPRSENLYKMLIDYLYRMTQDI